MAAQKDLMWLVIGVIIISFVYSGQTGMCGGVRGVSAGGVISSAFCLLFKVHTVRPTKKQVNTYSNKKICWFLPRIFSS